MLVTMVLVSALLAGAAVLTKMQLDSTRGAQISRATMSRLYCAESGIKDVGVIGVESGWEIYVAGNGGIKTEVAQFLCKVGTHDEVLEYAGGRIRHHGRRAHG